jgi:hypothetical protein
MVEDHGPQIKDDEQYEALRKRRAKKLDIAGRSRMRKDELIDAIRHR